MTYHLNHCGRCAMNAANRANGCNEVTCNAHSSKSIHGTSATMCLALKGRDGNLTPVALTILNVAEQRTTSNDWHIEIATTDENKATYFGAKVSAAIAAAEATRKTRQPAIDPKQRAHPTANPMEQAPHPTAAHRPRTAAHALPPTAAPPPNRPSISHDQRNAAKVVNNFQEKYGYFISSDIAPRAANNLTITGHMWQGPQQPVGATPPGPPSDQPLSLHPAFYGQQPGVPFGHPYSLNGHPMPPHSYQPYRAPSFADCSQHRAQHRAQYPAAAPNHAADEHGRMLKQIADLEESKAKQEVVINRLQKAHDERPKVSSASSSRDTDRRNDTCVKLRAPHRNGSSKRAHSEPHRDDRKNNRPSRRAAHRRGDNREPCLNLRRSRSRERIANSRQHSPGLHRSKSSHGRSNAAPTSSRSNAAPKHTRSDTNHHGDRQRATSRVARPRNQGSNSQATEGARVRKLPATGPTPQTLNLEPLWSDDDDYNNGVPPFMTNSATANLSETSSDSSSSSAPNKRAATSRPLLLGEPPFVRSYCPDEDVKFNTPLNTFYYTHNVVSHNGNPPRASVEIDMTITQLKPHNENKPQFNMIYDLFQFLMGSYHDRRKVKKGAAIQGMGNSILDYLHGVNGHNLLLTTSWEDEPFSKKSHPERQFLGRFRALDPDELTAHVLAIAYDLNLNILGTDAPAVENPNFFGTTLENDKVNALISAMEKAVRKKVDHKGKGPAPPKFINSQFHLNEFGRTTLIHSACQITYGKPVLGGDDALQSYPWSQDKANPDSPHFSQGTHIEGATRWNDGPFITVTHSLQLAHKNGQLLPTPNITKVYVGFNYHQLNYKDDNKAASDFCYYVPDTDHAYSFLSSSFPHGVGQVATDQLRFVVVLMFRAANPPGYGPFFGDMPRLTAAGTAHHLQAARNSGMRDRAHRTTPGPWTFDTYPPWSAMPSSRPASHQTVFRSDPHTTRFKRMLLRHRSSNTDKEIQYLYDPIGNIPKPANTLWVEFAANVTDITQLLQLAHMDETVLEKLGQGNPVHISYSNNAHFPLGTAPATNKRNSPLFELFLRENFKILRAWNTRNSALDLTGTDNGTIIGRINAMTIWPIHFYGGTAHDYLRHTEDLAPFLVLDPAYVIIMDTALFGEPIPFDCDVPSNGAIGWTAHNQGVTHQHRLVTTACNDAVDKMEQAPTNTTWVQTTMPPATAPRTSPATKRQSVQPASLFTKKAKGHHNQQL